MSILSFSLLLIMLAAVSKASKVKLTYENPKILWTPLYLFKPEKQREAAGRDADQDTFIGRVNVDDGQIVALYAPWWESFFYPNVLGEIEEAPKNIVQIFTYPRGSVTWTRRSAGFTLLPPNIVLAGFTPDTGENVYICRGRHKGRLVAGQLIMSREDGCLIIDENELYLIPDFEILSLNMYGIAVNAVGDTF